MAVDCVRHRHAVLFTSSMTAPSQARRWVGRAHCQALFTAQTRRTADLAGDALLEVEVPHPEVCVVVCVMQRVRVQLKRPHQFSYCQTDYFLLT